MNIRLATITDLETICNLNNQLFKLEKENYDSTLIENWPLSKDGKDYFTDMINNHYVVVAILNGKIVGYLAGSINEKGTYEEIQYGELNNMLITEECRGKGIGQQLINSFEKYCKSRNIFNIKVVASCKNKNAINFYYKNGFKDFDITLTMNIED